MERNNQTLRKRNRRSRVYRTLEVVIAVAAALVILFTYLLTGEYRAQAAALTAIARPSEQVVVDRTEQNELAFIPKGEVKAGLIFYPGANVEYISYAPLLSLLSEQGVLSVVVKMPLDYAFFDISACERVRASYPQVTDWYLGGHSLGGAMAASYISKHTAEYKGLFLYGAYSTKDLSASGLKVLSIYGSEDRVLNRSTYEKYKKNLPSDYSELVIKGGCHAYAGNYGAQKGDGTPTISFEEQNELASAAVCLWMNVGAPEDGDDQMPVDENAETTASGTSESSSDSASEEETSAEDAASSSEGQDNESEAGSTPVSGIDFQDVVFVGDSRTKTMASGGTYEFHLVPDDAVYATWGGQLTDESALADAKAAGGAMRKKAVFWFGINDVQLNPERDNADVFIQNYRAVISAYREQNPDGEIYLVSILNTTVNEKDHYTGQEENVKKYNEALHALAAESGYTYVDLTALLTGDECFYEGDDIHFSEAWYRDSFLPEMAKVLK